MTKQKGKNSGIQKIPSKQSDIINNSRREGSLYKEDKSNVKKTTRDTGELKDKK